MKEIQEIITAAQQELRARLSRLLESDGLQFDMYVRYLSMQFHLTKGVQTHFYRIAGHDALLHRKSLRSFLVKFADEEAPHFEVAERDLKNLGVSPLPMPLDVELWRSYFGGVIDSHPFIRLGATCILENIAGTSGDIVKELIRRSDYLHPKNLMFLTIHMHGEELPHGDQILSALSGINLTGEESSDLLKGAMIGRVQFMRLIDWALAFP